MVGNMYPPHHFGGYEQVWQSAVAHLRGTGARMRVLAVDFRLPGVPDGDQPEVHRELHWYWRNHDFPVLGLHRRLAIERHNQQLLAHHLDDMRPDVVGFWSMGGMSHSLLESVRRRGVPAVAFVHDEWLDYGRHTDGWLKLFYGRKGVLAPAVERMTGLPTRVTYAGAARYVFVSEFVRQRALALPLGLTDTGVAHSGINESFLQARERPPWRWKLLYVGRLHPDKGIADAVAALAQLPAEASLTFVGSWDEREAVRLQADVRRLGLEERVQMLGQRPRAALRDLYADADALLFPVRWEEPWGLVPLEAMGSGCPVVATGRGGSGEYLRDGDNCLLFPAGDAGALAAALRRLANSPELRERLRAGGLATAPRYTEAIFNAAVETELRARCAARQPVTTSAAGA
jgi:glycosyltransferase involved in cell wall biosynthesis